MIKHIVSLAAAVLAFVATTPAANAQSSPSLYTHATRYDAMGRVTGTIAPSAANAGQGYSGHLATRTTYDAAGRAIKVENGYLSSWQSEAVAPASWTGFTIVKTVETTYNAQSQKLTERMKGSDLVSYALTQYSYDSSGRLECTAVRMNPAAYGSLPSACTLGPQGSDGPDRITKNIYDAAGQLVQVREGVGAGSTIEAAEVTYGYTLNGKIEYVVDAGGHKARKCYDGYDREVRWVFPSTANPGAFNDATAASALSSAGAVNGDCTATTGDFEQYGYDSNGNRTSLRKRDGSTLTYGYDFLNRNIVKVVPERLGNWCGLGNPQCDTHTRDVYYSYDLRGLMTSARFGSTSGEGVIIGYDGFGRKTSETLVMDGVSRALGSMYDRNGNRTRLTYPDGNYVVHNNDGLDRPYHTLLNGTSSLYHTTFGSAGRLSMLYRFRPSVGWDQYSYYAYDAASRLSLLQLNPNNTSHDANTTLGYNPASQIASITRTNVAYSWNGQAAVSRNYPANGLNQYSAAGGTSFTYDANGNLTSDGTNTFTYDVENRLVARSGGGTSATLRYDPLGRLYESWGSNTQMLRYLHDADALVAEYTDGGTLLRRYIHGSSPGDDPLVTFENSGVADSARRYLYADERGSIVALTDADGYVYAINTYDEYGIPGSGNAGRFQYTGQAWLPELGMYYYKARMYSPTLGRFLQTDPIGYEDQFNLYGYVGNDPVNGVDPTGTYKCGGSESQCKDLKVFVRNLNRAASAGKTGSIMPNFQLRSAANFIGRDNGKGPNITFNNEKGNTGGSFDRTTNTINIDPAAISSTAQTIQRDNSGMSIGVAKGHAGAAILAHEGRHGADGRTSTNGATAYWREHDAYQTQAWYYANMGVRGFTGPFDMPGLGDRAMSSCTETKVGRADPGMAWYNGCATENIGAR